MKRIQILKNSVVTNQADFDTDNDAQAWLIQEIDNGSFGLTERWVKESECSAEDLAASLENRLVEPEFEESYTEHKLPAEFEVVEEEMAGPTYAELRKIQYQLRIDPFLSEAITDKEAGDSIKMDELLAEKILIKTEIPKPE